MAQSGRVLTSRNGLRLGRPRQIARNLPRVRQGSLSREVRPETHRPQDEDSSRRTLSRSGRLIGHHSWPTSAARVPSPQSAGRIASRVQQRSLNGIVCTLRKHQIDPLWLSGRLRDACDHRTRVGPSLFHDVVHRSAVRTKRVPTVPLHPRPPIRLQVSSDFGPRSPDRL